MAKSSYTVQLVHKDLLRQYELRYYIEQCRDTDAVDSGQAELDVAFLETVTMHA